MMAEKRRDVVLITGGNTGIGFQIARALLSSEHSTATTTYDVILAGLSLSKVQDAISSAAAEFPSSSSKLYPIQIDIEHDDSIQQAFEEVRHKFGRLDALVNNAGVQLDQQHFFGKMSEREVWMKSWNVNTAGNQIMTSTFMPLLLQAVNPRLLFMTSGTSTLAGTEDMALAVNKYSPKGWPKENFDGKIFNIPVYRSCKTGLNMMMREWHRTLHEDGVKVWAISPGFVATDLGGTGADNLRKMGAGDPEVAGVFVRSVLEGSRDADVGKVVLRDGVQAW